MAYIICSKCDAKLVLAGGIISCPNGHSIESESDLDLIKGVELFGQDISYCVDENNDVVSVEY